MSPSHIAMQMNGNLNHRQETKVSEMNKMMFTKVSNFGHHRNPYHDDHVKKVGTIRLPILPTYCRYIVFNFSKSSRSSPWCSCEKGGNNYFAYIAYILPIWSLQLYRIIKILIVMWKRWEQLDCQCPPSIICQFFLPVPRHCNKHFHHRQHRNQHYHLCDNHHPDPEAPQRVKDPENGPKSIRGSWGDHSGSIWGVLDLI